MSITISLSDKEVNALRSAFEAATEDHAQYMKQGNPEDDFSGIEGELEKYKKLPDVWWGIWDRVQSAQITERNNHDHS